MVSIKSCLFSLYLILLQGTIESREIVTFKDVTVIGYSVYVRKFNVTVESAKTLKDCIPKKSIYDTIEIKGASVPILPRGAIADLQELDELILESDNIQQISPGCINNIDSLRKLSFKNNSIEVVPAGVFNNLKLSILDLSLNKIKEISGEAFDDMPNLLHINLADNKLKAWSAKWFYNTPLLNRVSVQNNLIESLPTRAFENLGGQKQFRTLSLKLNLIFSHNLLKKFQRKVFEGVSEINHLWLDNNEIEVIPPQMFKNLTIGDLHLNDNKLHCIRGDLGQILKANINYIDGNPFNCTCLADIKNWAEKTKTDVQMFYADLNCRAERIAEKMKLLEQRLKEIKSDDKTA